VILRHHVILVCGAITLLLLVVLVVWWWVALSFSHRFQQQHKQNARQNDEYGEKFTLSVPI